MILDFDLDDVSTIEFGIGRGSPIGFFFVPTEYGVKQELLEMVHRTWSGVVGDGGEHRDPRQVSDGLYYEPSQKYGTREYCHLDLEDSLAEVFRNAFLAANLDRDHVFPRDLDSVMCYFVRIADREGRRLMAFRRAAYFKGIAKKKLIHVLDDSLRLVRNDVFKLDQDFDVIVDSRSVHVMRPNSFEALGGLKKAILGEVAKNVCTLEAAMPFIDFGPIESYARGRIRAARYLASIRQQNMLGVDRDAVMRQCRVTGVDVTLTKGKITVAETEVMGLLEVLDRRRYQVELVRERPESYRATGREMVRRR